jgi:hypothetical protein
MGTRTDPEAALRDELSDAYARERDLRAQIEGSGQASRLLTLATLRPDLTYRRLLWGKRWGLVLIRDRRG